MYQTPFKELSCINSFNPLRTLWGRNSFYYIIKVLNSSWPSKTRSFKYFQYFLFFCIKEVCFIGKYPLFSVNSIFDQLKRKLRVTIRKFLLSVKYKLYIYLFALCMFTLKLLMSMRKCINLYLSLTEWEVK